MKSSASLDWIISGLTFLAVVFLSFFVLYGKINDMKLHEKETSSVYRCINTYTIYISSCNKTTYYITNSPLYSYGGITLFFDDLNKYAVLLEPSKNYSYRRCYYRGTSDVIHLKDKYINNTFISINIPNNSILYGSNEVLKLNSSFFVRTGRGSTYYVEDSMRNRWYILPKAPEILYVGSGVLYNTSYFDRIFYDGTYRRINSTYMELNNKKYVCLSLLPVVCFSTESLLNLKIYNKSHNMSVEVWSLNNLIKISFGNYETCVVKELLVPHQLGYYYNTTCIQTKRKEVVHYDECNILFKETL